MIQPIVLLDLIIEAQRFTKLTGVAKRTYVFEQLGPLSQEEKAFIDMLIDTFLLLCKSSIDISAFQRRCWLFCPAPPRGIKAPTTNDIKLK